MLSFIAAIMIAIAGLPVLNVTTGDTALQARLDAIDMQGLPAIGIALVDGDEALIAVRGERALGSGVPVTVDDLWHLGSNTKGMTALLVAMLVEDGTLSWDDTIADHLPEVAARGRAHYRDRTFRDLLSHRAGVVANLGLVGTLRMAGTDAARNVREDRVQASEWLLKKSPVLDGGEPVFHYSNGGYVVAGAMIEAATGRSFDDLLINRLGLEMGLRSLGVGPPGSIDVVDQPRGHRGSSAQKPDWTADNPPALTPAGRAHLSLGDMASYLDQVMAGMRGEPGTVVQSAQWQAIASAPDDGEDYALGWGVLPDGRYAHAGSNTYWFVRWVIDPSRDRAVIFATNSGDLETARAVEADVRDMLTTFADGLQSASSAQ